MKIDITNILIRSQVGRKLVSKTHLKSPVNHLMINHLAALVLPLQTTFPSSLSSRIST